MSKIGTHSTPMSYHSVKIVKSIINAKSYVNTIIHISL